MNRRVFLYSLGGLVLAGCSNGCDKDDGIITGGSVAPKRHAPSPIGYSNVATLTANDVNLMAGYGLTLVQAEMIPFNEGADDTNVARHFPRIKDAVNAARAAGMVAFLTLVNWNGPGQKRQSTAWFRDLYNKVLQEIGPSGVWVEGVSEPDSSAKAREWINIALQWPGIKVVNGAGGHGGAGGGDILDWHYCDYAGLLSGVSSTDRLHSTDCGPVLGSRLSETQVKEVTQAAVDARRKLMLYDTSNAPGLNVNVVKWMGEIIQSGDK